MKISRLIESVFYVSLAAMMVLSIAFILTGDLLTAYALAASVWAVIISFIIYSSNQGYLVDH